MIKLLFVLPFYIIHINILKAISLKDNIINLSTIFYQISMQYHIIFHVKNYNEFQSKIKNLRF